MPPPNRWKAIFRPALPQKKTFPQELTPCGNAEPFKARFYLTQDYEKMHQQPQSAGVIAGQIKNQKKTTWQAFFAFRSFFFETRERGKKNAPIFPPRGQKKSVPEKRERSFRCGKPRAFRRRARRRDSPRSAVSARDGRRCGNIPSPAPFSIRRCRRFESEARPA